MPVDAKLAFRRPAEAPEAPAARHGAPQEQPERPHLPSDVPAARREAPPGQPERPIEKTSAPQKVQSPRRPWIRWALFAALPLALIAGAYWYVAGGQVMSTDDAYVEADTVGISTDVPGIVEEVDVTNNQHVEPGQVLYRLDPQQFQIALDNAKASLSQTALNIESMKQDYQRMLSDAAAQEGQVALDQATYDRNAALLPSGTTSKATYDQARFTLEVDKNKLESLRQQAAVQLARLAGNPNIPATQHPQYLQAKAQVDEAQRQLDHTIVKAPFAGTVTNVPSIAPGKYLAASMTAFYLVDRDHVWVDATPKETELTYVQPGQSVTVTVDTYPDAEWRGTVESISPAAAQQFSLLPAQNTSGNWVKVVQRVPMRVRVQTSDKNLPPLRAGMSVEVNVDTGHARGLPRFLTALFVHVRGSA
ncbi:MAG TPA: HlyD family secretion protein [Casimicrobiaceae bacterium]|jgi:membrane fusion protein (multidrug efflux system)|nr:HlyD family secretion protein [Casimicrobiaceae bacterium]